MRAPTNYSRGGLGFNMTPMIDVVFLLIIFFLVASRLAEQDNQLEPDLDLPTAGSGQRPGADEMRRVVVNVLPDQPPTQRIMVGGRLMGEDELKRLIRNKSRQLNRKIEVRIRSDRQVPYRMVEPIMIACTNAGVWKVTFAVRPD